jgi:hypothetical protein
MATHDTSNAVLLRFNDLSRLLVVCGHMASVKLTEAYLEKLISVDPKNPAAGPKRSRFVADSVRRGLMVNVTQNGTKTFHVRWTAPDGKSQRIAIPGGIWPDMRVSVARERADELLHAIRSKGHDPKAEKRAKRDVSVVR